MNNYKIQIPEIAENAVRELESTPFYKTEKGYQFAGYLLTDDTTETAIGSLLKADDGGVCGFGHGDALSETQKIFQETISALSEIVVSDENLTMWVTFKKAQGGVKEYHKQLEHLRETLFLIMFKANVLCDASKNAPEKKETGEENQLPVYTLKYQWGRIELIDQAEWQRRKNRGATQGEENMVLNHNNPFADISIKEQSFIYGSMMGQFEALNLSTSHTLTKVAKDTERSYIVLQPGFKIKKSKLVANTKKSDIVFDDTMTTEMTQNDNNIYVYID